MTYAGTITDEEVDKFARDLECSGAAHIAGPRSYSVKMVWYGPDDLPAYERVIDGQRDTILGWNSERFESIAAARNCAVHCLKRYYEVDMKFENERSAS